MTLGDRGLENVRTTCPRRGQGRATTFDVAAVPQQAVLLLDCQQFTRPTEPCAAPRVLQQHKGQQPARLGLERHEIYQRLHERDRRVGQICECDIGVPTLKARYSTARTPLRRSSSSSAGGTRYGIPAFSILRRALVRRCAIVVSGTRNARAISASCRPATVRSVNATRAERESAGWQHVKISRRRSSSTSCVSVDSSSTIISRSRDCSVLADAQPVDRSVSGGRCQPRGRSIGDSVPRPTDEGRCEGVLSGVLRKRPIARPPDQARDDAGPIGSVRGSNCRVELRQSSNSQNGRISMRPWRAMGCRDA